MRGYARLSAIFGLAATMALSVTGTAWGQTQKVKGIIVGRDGPNVIVKSESGEKVTLTLDDFTKVQAVKGKLGLRKDDMAMTALVPGLPIEAEAQGSSGQYTVKSVKFKASDLKTANMIQAGLNPTQEELNATKADQQALDKRFGELSEYDVKYEVTVLFAVNSATVDEKGKADLKVLADQAKQLKNFMVHVAGYTDSSGNPSYNQQLSDRRAAAVIAYLQQSCTVPLYRVLAPAAMGVSDPAQSNETTQGQAANRRVVVKVIVNRGISGGQ